MRHDPSLPLQALCSRCLAHRTDIDPAWLERLCAGRRWQQIDCGDDILFSGIGVEERADRPCPSCGGGDHVIAVHPSTAERFGPNGLGPPS
jgi:hypothetical protein